MAASIPTGLIGKAPVPPAPFAKLLSVLSLGIAGQVRRVAVGRFVRPELRFQLAEELRWALRRWSPDVAYAAH